MVKIKRSGRYFTYIAECSDKTYYTGHTNNLEERIKRHNQGLASKCTRARLPVTLVWKKVYRQFRSAFKAEIAIKNLTRMQKETLINGRGLDKVLAEAKGKKERKTGKNIRVDAKSGRQACAQLGHYNRKF